jgi:hypothetical protein
MARKPKADPKTRDPEEYKRFLETAREVEAEENPEAFERAFKRVARPKGAQKPGS